MDNKFAATSFKSGSVELYARTAKMTLLRDHENYYFIGDSGVPVVISTAEYAALATALDKFGGRVEQIFLEREKP